MTFLFLAEKWCRIRDSVSALNCKLASLASQNGQRRTCCVVLKATEAEKKDAANCGVELIIPCLSEEVVYAYGNDEPKPDWILSPENYFTTLMDLKDVEYIVEHIKESTKYLVSHVLRKRCFNDSNIVIVNHTLPPVKDENKNIHLKFAESTTAVFSIGPTVFEEYKNLYERTGIRVKHELYLPRPENVFFNLNLDEHPKSSNIKQILTVITDKDVETENNKVVSAAVGKTAEIFSSMQAKIPKWSVRTQSVVDPDKTRIFLRNNLECSCIEPIIHPPYGSQGEIYRDLIQSDVVVIPPDEPFSMEALQAIAAGLPVLVPKRTATAEFLKEYLDDKAEYFMYDPTSQTNELSTQISKMLNSCDTNSMVTQLKNRYISNETVSESHERFRKCFLSTLNLQTKPGNGPYS